MDPERPIEKLLREAAQARRAQAGAPQELHSVNRRLLQSEVARKHASATPARRSFFELFMPRLAWSAAVMAGLGLAASLMLPRQNSTQKEMFFAKNDRTVASHGVNEALPPAASAASKPSPETPALARTDVAQAGRDKDSLKVERRSAESQRNQLALNGPVPQSPISAGGPLAEEKQKKESASDAYGAAAPPKTPALEPNVALRSYSFTQPAPTPAAPAGTAGIAPSSEMKLSDERLRSELAYKTSKTAPSSAVPVVTSSAAQLNAATAADSAKRSPAPIARVTQQFVETGLLNKNVELADKSSVAKPILASFELQQLGREVRIIDSDGSVYSGSFQSPQALDYVDASARQKTAATRSLQDSEAQSERKEGLYDSKLQADLSYAFKVTGTNQSLNQMVTFTGQILAATNALSQAGPAGTLNGNRIAPPEMNPLPLQNSRISGKVLIGTNQEVEVNAIPAH